MWEMTTSFAFAATVAATVSVAACAAAGHEEDLVGTVLRLIWQLLLFCGIQQSFAGSPLTLSARCNVTKIFLSVQSVTVICGVDEGKTFRTSFGAQVSSFVTLRLLLRRSEAPSTAKTLLL